MCSVNLNIFKATIMSMCLVGSSMCVVRWLAAFLGTQTSFLMTRIIWAGIHHFNSYQCSPPGLIESKNQGRWFWPNWECICILRSVEHAECIVSQKQNVKFSLCPDLYTNPINKIKLDLMDWSLMEKCTSAFMSQDTLHTILSHTLGTSH